MKESFPDKHEIICGDIFCKSWWMRNDGETAWPAGTQLVQTSGDDMQAKLVTLRQEVAAGETFEFSVQCRAPEKEGRYTAFFRLQTGRIKFGHKVSCDILCVHPVPAAAKPEPTAMEVEENPVISEPLPQPVEMVAQEAVAVNAADKDMAEPERKLCDDVMRQSTAADEQMEAASESQPESALMSQSMLSIDAKTPKQLYYEQVEAEADPFLKEALSNLYESGFTDFKMNKCLFLKFKDVNAVANQLLTGALSESQFNSVFN